MRLYVPATLRVVSACWPRAPAGPLEAFAVTPELREWYVDDDPEALEYAALQEAARASCTCSQRDARCAAQTSRARRSTSPTTRSARFPSAIAARSMLADVRLSSVAAAHVDEAEGATVVARAASLVAAADRGDEDAELAVGDAEDLDLLWYATQELPDLTQG